MRAALPIAVLVAAALAASAQVALPIPGSDVPITLQTVVVCFAALSLGPGRAMLAVLLYLGLGATGLPVFAGGASGLDALRGPTGGYLVSFLAAPPVVVLGRVVLRHRWLGPIVGALAGHLVILVAGVLWLQHIQVWSWYRTLEAGLWPFLPGALLKSILAGALAVWSAPAKKA